MSNTKKKDNIEEPVTDREPADVEVLPAVREAADVPATQAEVFDNGLGDTPPEDLIVPRLKVGQDNSLEEDVASKWFIDISGDTADEMDLTVLRRVKGRCLLPEDYDPDNKPLCKSDNFITPVLIEGLTPMADTCDECSYSKWTKKSNGKPKPPRCDEVWHFLIIDRECLMPAWMSLKRTAMPAAKRITSMLNLRGKVKKMPCWEFSFKAKIEQSKKFECYVPVFFQLEELDVDERKIMFNYQDELKTVTTTVGKDDPDPTKIIGKNDDDEF
ncbi:MAG: hypothetical protein JJW03_05145 [Desulfosarcina sp.]|nr:hypothetical protein [Desulfobacterales bacterium]